jgi:prepilin-type N-terminal cleavage/methylation domain-containing protein
MRTGRISNVECRTRLTRAFTLFEIMIVIAIIGVVATIGMPSIVQGLKKEGMRKATSDIIEACSHARAAAIYSGQEAQLIIAPEKGTFSVNGASFSSTLPENVHIEFMGVDFIPDMQEWEEVRVRFFPNGTSSEFSILIRSDESELRKITLDVVTALPDLEVVK